MAPSTCTCSTRTTSWPATAPYSTPLQIVGSTGDYGRRLRAVVIGFGATARGAVTALNALGVHDVDVLTHREVAAVASPIHSARIVHFERRRHRGGGEPRRDRGGQAAAGRFPRGARHHRQLRAPGHRCPAHVPDRRRPRGPDARNAGRRRVLRRGHGIQLGAPHDVHRPCLRGRRQRPLLRRRPQPLLPVELGHVGDQRGAAPLPRRSCAERPRGSRTRPSVGPSRSGTVSSATPRSSPSSPATRTTRTPRAGSSSGGRGSDPFATFAPWVPPRSSPQPNAPCC